MGSTHFVQLLDFGKPLCRGLRDVGLAGTSWEWREAGLPVAWLGAGAQCS